MDRNYKNCCLYLKNKTLANTIKKKSPYEVFFNEKFCVKYLKVYDSRVFVRAPEQLRKTKWDDKASLRVLLGYTETGYRILINNRIINARHVDIIEEGIKCIGLSDDSITEKNANGDCESELSQNTDYQSLASDHSSKPEDVKIPVSCKSKKKVAKSEVKKDEPDVRRSSRVKIPNTKYFNNDYISNFLYVNYCDTTVPNMFEEAIESHESKNWKEAMNSEMISLEKNKTWKLVDKSNDTDIINVKWIYKRKTKMFLRLD